MEIIDLELVPWAWLFHDGSKNHIVQQAFLPDLIADLEARGFPHSGLLPIDVVLMDAPGPIFIGRPVETIIIEGMSIQIPCEDFAFIQDLVAESEARRFHNGSLYHKIHIWNNAVVLNPNQRDRLLDEMDARWESVLEAGEKFFKDKLENS